jgi:hypothetical protein
MNSSSYAWVAAVPQLPLTCLSPRRYVVPIFYELPLLRSSEPTLEHGHTF